MNITIINDTDIKGIFGGDHEDGEFFGSTVQAVIGRYLNFNSTGVGMEGEVSREIGMWLPNDDHNV